MPPFIGYMRVVEEKDPTELPLSLEEAKFRGRCRICGKKVNLTVPEDYPQIYDKVVGRTVGDLTLSYGQEYAHTACLINGKPHVSHISGEVK